MRIIHLSDIHLSKDNFPHFERHYRNSLIEELKTIASEKDIDLIIISGDLVDKGGSSLVKLDDYVSYTDPYFIFEKEFIDPLCEKIPILKEKILFISGNHDLQRDEIEQFIEGGLKSNLTSPDEVNRVVEKYKDKTSGLNFERIKKFLDFEERYHIDNKSLKYNFSEFESTAIYNFGITKIGIALMNDSWRCAENEVKDHFVGTTQFHRSLDYFEKEGTNFNIVVMHHPFECLNIFEKEEIENILHFKKFQLLLCGHEHNKRFEGSDFGNGNTVLYTRGRAAFDKPHETNLKYISGHTIIDVDFERKVIICNYRIYDRDSFRFSGDMQGHGPKKEYNYGVSEEFSHKINGDKLQFTNNFDKNKFINKSEND